MYLFVAPVFAESDTKYCIDDLIQSINNNNTKIRKADEEVVQAHLDTKDAEAGYQPVIELSLMGMYMANPLIDDITINTNDILLQMNMSPLPESYDLTYAGNADAPEHFLIFTLEGGIEPVRKLELYSRSDLVLIWNKDNVQGDFAADFQFTAGVRYSI